ncbi:MAG: hypothetical protein AAB840_02715 [Patescibacteria group bacterium]
MRDKIEKMDKKILIALPVIVLVALSIWARASIIEIEYKENQRIVASPYDLLTLNAKSVYVFDIKTKEVLYSKNEEMQWPLASVSKLMTAIVAKENAPSGFSIRTADVLLQDRGGGDIRSGEWWNLADLIDFSLVSSSNDGALAIASAIGAIDMKADQTPEESFIIKMNEKARALGMNQTYFVNSYGLDISENFAGAYGSAKDISHLLNYAHLNHQDIIENTSRAHIEIESLSGIKHNIKNTNEITGELSGLVASKTGFTDLSGGNLAIIFEVGPTHPVIAIVLGSTKEDRFSEIKKLHKATLFEIRLRNLSRM